jgi:hypothetical protein
MSQNLEETYFLQIAQFFPREVREELVKQMRDNWKNRDYPERTGKHMIELLKNPCIKILLQNTVDDFLRRSFPNIQAEKGEREKKVIIHGTLTNIAATWVNGIDTFLGQKEYWWTKDGRPLATKQLRQASTANRCGLLLIPDGASYGFPASLPPEGGVIEKEYLTTSEKKKKIGPSLDDYEWVTQKKDWILIKGNKKGGKKKLSRKRRI